MQGKVCLVTGATGSLGKATANALAQLGATVILACRNNARGQIVKSEIISTTGNSSVELAHVDLSSQHSIREMAAEFNEIHDRLDVLIHTAAIYKSLRILSADDLELMFAANHIGPFLLTSLLLDKLIASAPARVLVAAAPSTSPLNFEDLQSENRFNPFQVFGMTKMCNLLFTYELARRLDGTGVSVNAVHPGLIKSNLMRETPFFVRMITQLLSGAPDKAASSMAYLASSPDAAKFSGKFLKYAEEIESNNYSNDLQVQRRLWNESEALTNG